jgi:RecJ-like exonuclease
MDFKDLTDLDLRELLDAINAEILRREVHEAVCCPACDGTGVKTKDQIPQYQRCPKCNGTGKISEFEYCICLLGRDLKKVEKRWPYMPAHVQYSRGEPDYAKDGTEDDEPIEPL